LPKDDRFDRMERTGWIDMSRIHGAPVFVAGAGALGNEVIKNLVLAGFRDITVADFDTVERSNLSRCVLFREESVGRNKAEVVAEAASELDPECRVTAVPDTIQRTDLSRFGIFIGCLDSISARLHLNAHARFFRIPYVDGATDGFRGKMQTVFPKGPCLECGMNSTHLEELHRTFSCIPGETVRDPVILSSGITTTAVIAAMCVREVLKIACGRTDLCVPGVSYYDGISGRTDVLEVGFRKGCPHHEGELSQ
jgi:molybdopterin/thiamine biosynthesis adenylyltransferase